MKQFALLFLTFALTSSVFATEKPTRHLEIADVTSLDEAKQVFLEKTAEIKSKKSLDASELQQIHIITYSLEKGIAYFAEHLNKEKQALAKEIAVVVEDIHIHSENNRKAKTQAQLTKYFALAEELSAGLEI